MHADVVDLREFYLSSLGLMVRRLLRQRVTQIWPNLRGERVLALGYGVPLLRPLLGHAGQLFAFMPPEQGVAYWPREGPNISCFADSQSLPLPDESIDCVILLHALEGVVEPDNMLRELWRVMKSGGRMLMFVSNRRGLWAHSDRTPFGTGQPYSGGQIRNILRDQGFITSRIGHALYMPPTSSRLLNSLADKIEKVGEKVFPGFGGVLVVEAGKQLYAPLLTKSRVSRRLVLPLPPLPSSVTPVPS